MRGETAGGRPAAGGDRGTLAGDASAEAILGALLPAQLAVYVKDRDGRYLMSNAAGAVVAGCSQEEILGRTDSEIFPGELGARMRRNDEEIMAAGEARTVEEPVIVGGQLRTYLSTKAPLRDPGGDVIGIVGASMDVTSLREADEELARREAHLAEAQALTGVGSWEWDVGSGEARWSLEHYRILGRDPLEYEATFENYLACIHPDDREAIAAQSERVTAPGSSGVAVSEYRIVRPGGEIRTVKASGRVFYDADGTPLRMIGAVQDVTEQRNSERELAARQEQLSVAQELTGIGSWDWDPVADRVTWSPTLFRIFRIADSDFDGTVEGYLARVHPDDRDARRTQIEDALRGQEPAVSEHRIVRGDGEERIVRAAIHAIRDQDGRVVRLIGACEDISERRRSERELERRARREALVARLGRMALAGEDIRAEVSRAVSEELSVETVRVEHAVQADSGSFAEAVLSAREPVTVPDWSAESRFEPVDDLKEGGIRASAGVAIRGYRGVRGRLTVHSRRQRSFDASDLWLLESLSRLLGEAMERVQAGERMRIQALTDPLTGLPNRALLYDRLRHALELASRTGERAAVMFIDLDGFKVVNDEMGHPAGDELLAAAAQRLREVLRVADTLARLGGDEFVAVCENVASVGAAIETAERLRAALAAPFTVSGRAYRISASIGTVFAADRHKTPADIVRDADRAMYAAKQDGGDRVALFDD